MTSGVNTALEKRRGGWGQARSSATPAQPFTWQRDRYLIPWQVSATLAGTQVSLRESFHDPASGSNLRAVLDRATAENKALREANSAQAAQVASRATQIESLASRIVELEKKKLNGNSSKLFAPTVLEQAATVQGGEPEL